MVKSKNLVFILLIFFFLLFSFFPTLFELSQAAKLADPAREFILEHNYYWPDFNLYLSKIRQGYEGYVLAKEKYTSEPHRGSLIQEFYVILGLFGRFLGLEPNFAYQLGRLILSPLLLIVIISLVKYYFPFPSSSFSQNPFLDKKSKLRTFVSGQFSSYWPIFAFLIVVISGSFPRFYTDTHGTLHVGRFMEWWSNIDALQRITFIPHILFGQIVSFYLLYRLVLKPFYPLSIKRLIFYISLGNATGLVFPPSLITLIGVLVLIVFLKILKRKTQFFFDFFSLPILPHFALVLFIFFSAPSLLYLFFLTKQIPWSALLDFHRTHPMMIPLDQYVLGTGPIFFLGFLGAIISILKRENRFQPLIFWLIVNFSLASFFSIIKEQSPLRFTQTGVFIPLGILGAYFFQQIFRISFIWHISLISLFLYLLTNLFMMKVSLDWQITFIKQRLAASVPLVPSPPQTMYPLRSWLDGIRWLRDNTNHEDIVLAEITAANYIPAYAGNFVYFGQANTVDYERKKREVDKFFRGKMKEEEAKIFLKNGRIKYVFFSVQEKEKSEGKNLEEFYPFLQRIYSGNLVTIYSLN